MSISRSHRNRLGRKQKLLEKLKESENSQNLASNISNQIKNKSNNQEGHDISKLEIYLLPRVFPHIFGNKIPKKRSETIDMYMHYTPSKIEDPLAARKHAKNEMFNGMVQHIITKLLPIDYFLFLACFTLVGTCYYKFVVLPKKQLEEASSLQSELSMVNPLIDPVSSSNTESTEDDFDEFEKKYKIVKNCKNEVISNYLKNKNGNDSYQSVHEELQKIDLVTGKRKESFSVEPIKRPTMGHLPNLIGETYEESLISSVLVEDLYIKIKSGHDLILGRKSDSESEDKYET